MNYNLLNGGLVIKARDQWMISDMQSFATDPPASSGSGMRWFMNADDEYMYYSDQRKGNALCRMNLDSRMEEVLLDRPCGHIVLSQGWLYFIDEDSRKLHRCLTNGRQLTKLTDDAVNQFLLADEVLCYAAQNGIYLCAETGAEREKISDASASLMVRIGHRLAYADKQNRYTLTLLDLNANETETLEDIAPSSLNTDGKYLYCANRRNDRNIYRIDPLHGQSLRICGESAEYLHIIENDLVFCIRKEWHRMPVAGGPFEKLRR